MDFEDRFHVKTFKDCSLIEASNVFKAYARAFSISKNNMNSSQSTEQSQATSVDSTKVDVDYK